MSTDDSDGGEDDAETATVVSAKIEGVPTAGEATVETIRHRARDGTLQLGGAAIAALLAVATRGRNRAVATVVGLLGVGLAVVGYRRRQSDDQQPSDAATESESGSQTADVSFTEDRSEPRSKPELDDESTDPRREGDITEPAQDGEGVTIDISEPSMANEPGEATGPDPEQAQPTRTAAPEPETGADPEQGDPTTDVEDERDAGTQESDGPDTVESDGHGTDESDSHDSDESDGGAGERGDGSDESDETEANQTEADESSDESNADSGDDEH